VRPGSAQFNSEKTDNTVKLNQKDDSLQWKSDLEMVRESLRRLQEEKLVLIKPYDDNNLLLSPPASRLSEVLSRISTDRGKNLDHNIMLDEEQQRVKKLRFDTDEIYLAYIGKNPEEQYSRQSIQEPGVGLAPTAYKKAPSAAS